MRKEEEKENAEKKKSKGSGSVLQSITRQAINTFFFQSQISTPTAEHGDRLSLTFQPFEIHGLSAISNPIFTAVRNVVNKCLLL